MIRNCLTLTFICIFLSPACAGPHEGRKSASTGGEHWIHLEPGDKKLLGGYELFLKKTDASLYRLYLRREKSEAYRFISGEIRLFADIRISPQQNYLLINAPCSSISWCVFVTDIKTGRSWVISGEANRVAKANRLPGKPRHPTQPSASISPLGDSFSPDETKVLLKMVRLDLPIPPKQNGEGSTDPHEFKQQLIVVDTLNGKVLKEFQTENSPERWWSFESEPQDYLGNPE